MDLLYRLLGVALLISSLAPAHGSPAASIDALEVQTALDTGTLASVTVGFGNGMLRSTFRVGSSSQFSPGSWVLRYPFGLLGHLVPAGVYRRLDSRRGYSLFAEPTDAPPLTSGSAWEAPDRADMLLRLGARRIAPAAFVDGREDSERRGAALMFASGSGRGALLLLTSRDRGRLAHLAGTVGIEFPPISVRSEVRLSAGRLHPPATSVSIGVGFEIERLRAEIELWSWGRRYVLPQGVVPPLSFLLTGKLLAATRAAEVRVVYRLEADRPSVGRALYRGSTETMDAMTSFGKDRFTIELEGGFRRRVEPDAAEPIEPSVSVGLRLDAGRFKPYAKLGVRAAPTSGTRKRIEAGGDIVAAWSGANCVVSVFGRYDSRERIGAGIRARITRADSVIGLSCSIGVRDEDVRVEAARLRLSTRSDQNPRSNFAVSK